ncbi:conserved hypothetical protein [Methanococcus aeolicus Nankai-3]|uniref:DUF4350 domain-containing protein n=1 Tax=Methanococcus aeolicus (strain ATCC BAA-1280 / DSM 17508 / OCM 812 / Nankai-3) TaxID=419665 RepID=A6UU23_META3|nr:DUF4350 domain-containing protein [Methanococcus aeolicus]ABR55995.1 conserved hypothetical protein [Methanococcus aeolicus Nankai-3]
MNNYIKYISYAIVGISLLSLPLSIPFIQTNQEYNIFNKEWNGCSEFGKIIYATGKPVPLMLPYSEYEFNDGVLIIIASDIKYSDSSISIIKEFLNRGNVVIIADDTGNTNNIYKELQLPVKIINNQPKDLFYLKDDDLLITPNIKGFDGKIITNKPSYIDSKNGEIIRTSSISNKILMEEINYSNGKIIVISDPDIFINGMKNHNKDFWTYLLNDYKGKTIYIDEAHRSTNAVYDIGTSYVQNNISNDAKFVLFIIMVLIFYLIKRIDLDIFNFLFKKKINLKKISEENNIEYDKLAKMIQKIKD